MATFLPSEAIEDLQPRRFWEEYVQKRKPVKIVGFPTDTTWIANEKWTLPYLRSKAGSCTVEVEERTSLDGFFGKGKKKSTLFNAFVSEIESGNERLYLSAQHAAVGSDGFPELLSPPLTLLAEDICLRPSLLGNLIPQQINLWMGCALIGSSSGLHHDYHDNLYVLLKGNKHFSLFPPDEAHRMYTNGKIKHVHSSGRIVYHGQGDVRADGAYAVEVDQWEKKISRIGSTKKDGNDSTDEEDLEAILGRFEEERDDYNDAVDLPDDDSPSESRHQGKRQKPNEATPQQETKANAEPLNFSQVDLTLPIAAQKEEYPLFPGFSAAVQCELSEGQMLFLPAGWFHNVTSYSGQTSASNYHLAVNYWCYPPDNLKNDDNDLPATFNSPYLSNYWPAVWEFKKQ